MSLKFSENIFSSRGVNKTIIDCLSKETGLGFVADRVIVKLKCKKFFDGTNAILYFRLFTCHFPILGSITLLSISNLFDYVKYV